MSKRFWLWLGLWLLLILPVTTITLASASIIVYMYWPRDYAAIDYDQFALDTDRVVILVHGVKDDTTTWIDQLKAVYQSQSTAPDVVGLDWSEYAKSSMRCAIDGRRIGRKVGTYIAANSTLQSIQFVGHSCGAFVILGACEALRAANSPVTIQTTYLDPVSVYGLAWDYGIKHFGTCGDYSEAYIDTGDSIPGSNQLIPNTRTYDVTQVRVQANSPTPPHLFPIVFYESLVRQARAPELWTDKALPIHKPPGILESVNAW